ncbi:hypothetical protein ACFL01_04535 [Planctomycetota bacterium]
MMQSPDKAKTSAGTHVLRILALLAIVTLLVILTFAFYCRHVEESRTPLSLAEAPAGITLSGTFPESARDIYYASASVGPGGKFKAYRFSAPVADLHAHAEAEFKNHWEELTPTKSFVSRIFLDKSQWWIFGVDGSWFDVIEIPKGYQYMDEHGVHRSIIWVDEEREIFYFLMGD